MSTVDYWLLGFFIATQAFGLACTVWRQRRYTRAVRAEEEAKTAAMIERKAR